MKFVLDTDVVVAGMRSPRGASAEILRRTLRGEMHILMSVPLALEYESVCLLPEHRLAAQASEYEIQNFLDALISQSIPVEVHYQWRPQLRDAGDEMVLETAVNGKAKGIVSFNFKDYGKAPEKFGISLFKPAQILQQGVQL